MVCGRELPNGALYCPSCGTRAADYTLAQSEFSPSHFNTGFTATSQPYSPEENTVAIPSSSSSSSPASEARRLSGRKGFVLVVILVLAVLLVGVTFETGMLTSSPGGSAVNSPTTPLTGKELYSVFIANESQFNATYLNKTVYVQDSLDYGVSHLFSTGQFYSSVNSGTVVLLWSDPSQVDQLYAGAVVLVKCSVGGAPPAQTSLGIGQSQGPELDLRGCDLISVQAQTTTSVQSASTANL